jgi:hypothetical protein
VALWLRSQATTDDLIQAHRALAVWPFDRDSFVIACPYEARLCGGVRSRGFRGLQGDGGSSFLIGATTVEREHALGLS